MWQLFSLGLLASAAAQKIGSEILERHPPLSWKRCKGEASCQTVKGEVVIDSNWRWLHNVGGFTNCFDGAEWNPSACNSTEACTENCALEGASYQNTYGITTKNDSVSLKYRTNVDFGTNLNSRIFLMENENRYQLFTLLNNEIAVDVDLSSVGCGVNAALYFVAMEPDGGKASYPSNKAGAKYGTGYCDASCTRSLRYNGGKANYDDWTPSLTDRNNGEGYHGACCSEFDVLNSNAHSYSMSSKPCINVDYEVCEAPGCDLNNILYPGRGFPCDRFGCDYQPYRLDNKDFYGRGKTVDTTRTFTVVTRFEEKKVTQFFIQDGKKIEVPAPATPGFPKGNGITEDYCDAKSEVFQEYDQFNTVGGFSKHIESLSHPMVLTMAITDDHWVHNLWLDSVWPIDAAPLPGTQHGPCRPESNDPQNTMYEQGRAGVMWSNIRFGPVGSTVVV